MKKSYISNYDETKLESKFNRSNLSFKYKLLRVEKFANAGIQPTICLVLSPKQNSYIFTVYSRSNWLWCFRKAFKISKAWTFKVNARKRTLFRKVLWRL